MRSFVLGAWIGLAACTAPTVNRGARDLCVGAEEACRTHCGEAGLAEWICEVSDQSHRSVCRCWVEETTPAKETELCRAEREDCEALCAKAGVALFRCESSAAGWDSTCECVQELRRAR